MIDNLCDNKSDIILIPNSEIQLDSKFKIEIGICVKIDKLLLERSNLSKCDISISNLFPFIILPFK
jgi:hypothetical protein